MLTLYLCFSISTLEANFGQKLSAPGEADWDRLSATVFVLEKLTFFESKEGKPDQRLVEIPDAKITLFCHYYGLFVTRFCVSVDS